MVNEMSSESIWKGWKEIKIEGVFILVKIVV